MTTNAAGPHQPSHIPAQYRGALFSALHSHLELSRDSHATTSGFRRQLEDCNSESLVYVFCGTLPQSCSIFILLTPSLPWRDNHLRDFRCLDASTAPRRLWCELDSPQATDVGINHCASSATKQPQQIWTANVFSVSRARFSSK